MSMDSNLAELRNMIVSFRISELQVILGYAGCNKNGRKCELQQRVLELLRLNSADLQRKIREIYASLRQASTRSGDDPLMLDISDSVNITMPQQAQLPQQQQQHQQQQIDTATMQYLGNTAQITCGSVYKNMHWPPIQLYGVSSTESALAQYLVHPGVKLKRLPFFDVMYELLPMCPLILQSDARMQTTTLHFQLTPQQAAEIGGGAARHDATKQVQMRFCMLDTTCEQEDCFPPNIGVKVNNRVCGLPNPLPSNKPGLEPKRPPRPLNISRLVKVSPTAANTVTITWTNTCDKSYGATIAFVHKRNSSDLLQRLKSRGVKHPSYTDNLIKEKLRDADCEIATVELRVSLMCPLGKMRMQTACRSSACRHFQCFDASVFLQMNERKPTWRCPVCDQPALYDDLIIDGYFQQVLESPLLAADTNDIQLHYDGSWSIRRHEMATDGAAFLLVDKLDDSVQILEDIECVTSSTADVVPKLNTSIIDLTESDTEEDERQQSCFATTASI